MKLSEIIIEYRSKMGISQREFARHCGLSNSYISFLENEVNPRTGKPIIPTIEQYKKLSDGMSISVQELFTMLDENAPVGLTDISNQPISSFDRLLIKSFHAADPGIKESVMKLLDIKKEKNMKSSVG